MAAWPATQQKLSLLLGLTPGEAGSLGLHQIIRMYIQRKSIAMHNSSEERYDVTSSSEKRE